MYCFNDETGTCWPCLKIITYIRITLWNFHWLIIIYYCNKIHKYMCRNTTRNCHFSRSWIKHCINVVKMKPTGFTSIGSFFGQVIHEIMSIHPWLSNKRFDLTFEFLGLCPCSHMSTIAWSASLSVFQQCYYQVVVRYCWSAQIHQMYK